MLKRLLKILNKLVFADDGGLALNFNLKTWDFNVMEMNLVFIYTLFDLKSDKGPFIGDFMAKEDFIVENFT